MIDPKNQFAGNGDQTPNPGEDDAHTAQIYTNKGYDAVRIAQENAMWAAYNAERSAEAAMLEAEWLNAEILDGEFTRGDVKGNMPDDMTDDEVEMLFNDAAAATAVAKGMRANRYRKKGNYAKRCNRTPQHGFLPVPCRKKFLDGIPEGALPKGKLKRVCWYDTDKRCLKRVKLTPNDNRPYQLQCVHTRKGGSRRKSEWKARPDHMLEPPEDESINVD